MLGGHTGTSGWRSGTARAARLGGRAIAEKVLRRTQCCAETSWKYATPNLSVPSHGSHVARGCRRPVCSEVGAGGGSGGLHPARIPDSRLVGIQANPSMLEQVFRWEVRPGELVLREELR